MDKNSPARELLLEIVKCPNFGGNSKSCKPIFATQTEHADKLLPVPWQGHLGKAKILFISSNPSPLKNGIMASKSWLDKNEIDKIIDFYESRFDNRITDINKNQLKWSEDGTKYRTIFEPPEDFKDQRYWMAVKNIWMNEIGIYRPLGEMVLGETYALTEIVHCYSLEEKGVHEAKRVCSKHSLKNILEAATNVELAVVFGFRATPIINEYFKCNRKLDIYESLDWHPLEYRNKKGQMIKKTSPGLVVGKIDYREVIFIALPYPTKRNGYPFELDKYLTETERNILRGYRP